MGYIELNEGKLEVLCVYSIVSDTRKVLSSAVCCIEGHGQLRLHLPSPTPSRVAQSNTSCRGGRGERGRRQWSLGHHILNHCICGVNWLFFVNCVVSS